MASTLFDLMAKITLDTNAYESGLNRAEGGITAFGNKLKTGLGTIAKVGAAALGAAAAGVVAFAKSSVSAGMEFDASMSQVAATMGTTVDQIQHLRDFAQEMGATTAFSATQAADALNYMALAGYDAETSMAMLPNVLNLAAAGGMELAAASDMVTDSQSALGLTLDETSELVDKMAKASSKSNTSVSQLGEAMLTVGGTAKTLNGGTTELATALGILADNGIKGSEGGTALRNVILALSAPTEQAKEQLDELGVSVYDADGNMRSLSVIFGELNAELSKMSQGKKTEVLNKLFNKVDLKSANALLDTSADRWNELADAIDNAAGAAKEMADTQLDNLQGDITLFKSALEGVQIALSDGLTPSIREFVQIATDGLSELATAIKAGDWKGAFSIIGDTIGDEINKISDLGPQVIEGALSLLEAFSNSIIENADTLIDSAGEVIDTLLGFLEINAKDFGKTAGKIITKLAKAIADNAADIVTGSMAIVTELANGLLSEENVEGYVTAAGNIVSGVLDALPETITTLKKCGETILDGMASGAVDAIPSVVGDIAGTLFNELDGAVKSGDFSNLSINLSDIIYIMPFGAALKPAITLIENLLKGIKDGSVWENFVSGMYQRLFDVDTVEGLDTSDMAEAIHGKLREALDNIKERVKGWIEDKIAGVKEWLDEKIWTPISDFFTGIYDKIVTALEPVTTFLSNTWNTITNGISIAWNTALGIVQPIIDALSGLFSAFGELAAAVWAAIQQAVENAINWIKDNVIQPFVDWFNSTFTPIFEAAKNAVTAAWEAIKSAVGAVIDWFQSKLDAFKAKFDEAKTKVEEFGTKVKNVWEEIKAAIQEKIQAALSWGQDLMTNLAQGIANGISAVTTAVKNVATTIWENLHQSTAEVGPLKDTDKWGGDMMDNIINGIESRRGQLERTIADVANSMDIGSTDFTAAMTGSVAFGDGFNRQGGEDSVGKKLDEVSAKLTALIEAMQNQVIEMDGEAVATAVNRRLGDAYYGARRSNA